MSNSNTDNKKIYCILSYIGILWLIGLLVQEKDDPKVKFHVGQGMILSIIQIGLIIIVSIVLMIIRMVLFGGGIWGAAAAYLSPTYNLISTILWLVFSIGPLVLAIIGILNAVNDKENKLPLIGNFAFYK